MLWKIQDAERRLEERYFLLVSAPDCIAHSLDLKLFEFALDESLEMFRAKVQKIGQVKEVRHYSGIPLLNRAYEKERPMTELETDAFRTLGSVDAIPNDFAVPYYLDDRKRRIAIARVDHRLYALDDLSTCNHKACPLSGGLLTGTTIMCQCHGSRFDITTGAVVNGPATAALNVCAVQEEEGAIRVRI